MMVEIWLFVCLIFFIILLFFVFMDIRYFATQSKEVQEQIIPYNPLLNEFIVKANTYAKKEDIRNFPLSLVYSGLICSKLMEHNKSFAEFLTVLEDKNFCFVKNIQTDEYCLVSSQFGNIDDFIKEIKKE